VLNLYVFTINQIYLCQAQQSPTLDLINDCFRFVTGFFEVISTSAPHIYKSALLLSPRMSTIWKLYQPLSNPLIRVIQGVPNLWDPSIVNKKIPHVSMAVFAWSPCSRFIAIGMHWSQDVKILDAVTLEQLYTLPHTNSTGLPKELVFSPDGHLLAEQFSGIGCHQYVCWDLQTGGLISTIPLENYSWSVKHSASYSGCGTMLRVLRKTFTSSCIYTYNILSGMCMSSYKFDHPITGMIWTHSENPQYVVCGSESITIWELGTTPNHMPTKINSLPIPDNPHNMDCLLSPSFSQVAYIDHHHQRVMVWDIQHCKILLDSADAQDATNMTFSSDDHFFACGTSGPELYLWKQSPSGYLLHQKFLSSTGPTKLIISPDSGSIVAFSDSMLHLWHISNSPTSPSNVPTQAPQHTPAGFIVDFSSDERFVAVRGKLGKGINVLNLKSGHLQLAIDTVVEVYAMRMLGSTITACCHDGKVIAWDIPAGNHVINTRVDAQSSVQTFVSEHLVLSGKDFWMSISPDLSSIAVVKYRVLSVSLQLYDIHTGKLFTINRPTQYQSYLPALEYIPPGYVIWCDPAEKKLHWWEIARDAESNIIGVTDFRPAEDPPKGFQIPWNSSHGYQVTYDGWILSPNGQRLLWLPPHWRGDESTRRWSGKFLALLHGELPEAVILELEV